MSEFIKAHDGSSTFRKIDCNPITGITRRVVENPVARVSLISETPSLGSVRRIITERIDGSYGIERTTGTYEEGNQAVRAISVQERGEKKQVQIDLFPIFPSQISEINSYFTPRGPFNRIELTVPYSSLELDEMLASEGVPDTQKVPQLTDLARVFSYFGGDVFHSETDPFERVQQQAMSHMKTLELLILSSQAVTAHLLGNGVENFTPALVLSVTKNAITHPIEKMFQEERDVEFHLLLAREVYDLLPKSLCEMDSNRQEEFIENVIPVAVRSLLMRFEEVKRTRGIPKFTISFEAGSDSDYQIVGVKFRGPNGKSEHHRKGREYEIEGYRFYVEKGKRVRYLEVAGPGKFRSESMMPNSVDTESLFVTVSSDRPSVWMDALKAIPVDFQAAA